MLFRSSAPHVPRVTGKVFGVHSIRERLEGRQDGVLRDDEDLFRVACEPRVGCGGKVVVRVDGRNYDLYPGSVFEWPMLIEKHLRSRPPRRGRSGGRVPGYGCTRTQPEVEGCTKDTYTPM